MESPLTNTCNIARPAEGHRLAQPLRDHLKNVADLSADFAESFDLAVESKYAGMLHDLGKYRPAFQEYLAGQRGQDSETWHSIDGAKVAAQKRAISQAFAIAGHHSGLHDLADLQDRLNNSRTHITPELVERFKEDFGDLPTDPGKINSLPNKPENKYVVEFATRMLFSVLVDADRLDAAFWPDSPPAERVLDANVLLQKLKQAIAQRHRRNSPMQLARDQVFRACLAAGEQPQGFFSLNVPTGGGKTLASMAFALTHAKQHGLRRIVVVIPYLSIIEQNAAEYSRVFGTDVVQECHSAVETTDSSEQTTQDLWSENWDAPLIVTTSVQFLESLLAASPARCRKLHRLARSVVVFDEVQTIPPHLMRPVLSVMREMALRYRTSFLFCSATTPAFKKTSNLPEGFSSPELKPVLTPGDEAGENTGGSTGGVLKPVLAPDDEVNLFKGLRRVRYHLPKPEERMSWQELASKLAEQSQVLCVVNTTRQARDLWMEMKNYDADNVHKTFHLSAGMCAQHRFDTLNDIKSLLRHSAPCRVISTQLIEAGVDIDFPCVWRAFGPLDSIVQVAGRCNRENRHKSGDLYIFHPIDESLPRGVYSTATDQAAVELARLAATADPSEALATDPALFARYFNALYGLMDVGADIQEMRASFKFRSVADEAKVIKDSGQPIIVPYGIGPRLLDTLHILLLRHAPYPEIRAGFQAMQRYMVNLRQYNYERFLAIGAIKAPWEGAPVLTLQDGYYNNDLGLVVEDRPLEDLII